MTGIVSGLALGAVVAVAPLSPASAITGESGKLNLYQNQSYSGHTEARISYDNDFGNDECDGCDPGWGGDFEDDATSYVNKTGYWWVLAEHDNQGGQWVCVRPNSHDGDLSNNTTIDDEISSVERKGTSRPSGCDAVIGYAN